MTQYIIGVDPGMNGAIAILTNTGELIQVFDMPCIETKVGKSIKRRVSAELIATELRLYQDACACVERVNAMPGQGVSSSFGFGESYGLVRGVLAALQIPTQLVSPVVWKKSFGLSSLKDASRAKAIQIWPAHAGEFKRVKDADRAEAALLAKWLISSKP